MTGVQTCALPISFFDTLTVEVGSGRAAEVLEEARKVGINLRPVDEDRVAMSFDETSEVDTVRSILGLFGVEIDLDGLVAGAPGGLAGLERTSDFMTHPVFHEHRTETEMLRYLRHLADLDIGLDRSMIPLGSCTMKLNATTEMIPITWPRFANLHPFAPLDQANGYLELFAELEAWLVAITGYDAVSLQPNAGSQGEYAGLLAIRGYHASRGEAFREIGRASCRERV